MPCYLPLNSWGKINPDGKVDLVFNPQEGFEYMPVPCRKCEGCLSGRSQSWATRAVHEKKYHSQAEFWTLTYDDENMPKNAWLDHRDVQLFMKRVRAYQADYYQKNNLGKAPKIKYLMCGEYGDRTDRPHYHMIVYGFSCPDKKLHSRTPRGDQLYTSKILSDLWGKGHCPIGNVTAESARYTANYVMKDSYQELKKERLAIRKKIRNKIYFESASKLQRLTGNEREAYLKKIRQRIDKRYRKEIEGTKPLPYLIASKGFGASYIDDHLDDVYRNDGTSFVVIRGHQVVLSSESVARINSMLFNMSQGFRYENDAAKNVSAQSISVSSRQVPVPSYYDERLKKVDPVRYQRVKNKRRELATKPERLIDSTPERLAVRREVKQQKMKMLNRPI